MEHDEFVLLTSILEEIRGIRQAQEFDLTKKYPELAGDVKKKWIYLDNKTEKHLNLHYIGKVLIWINNRWLWRQVWLMTKPTFNSLKKGYTKMATGFNTWLRRIKTWFKKWNSWF
jgi:hypothetical protein